MKLLKDNVFVTYPHSLTTGQGDATVDTVLETPGFREIKRIYWEKYFQASVFISREPVQTKRCSVEAYRQQACDLGIGWRKSQRSGC